MVDVDVHHVYPVLEALANWVMVYPAPVVFAQTADGPEMVNVPVLTNGRVSTFTTKYAVSLPHWLVAVAVMVAESIPPKV
jgi:hypothetical protein